MAQTAGIRVVHGRGEIVRQLPLDADRGLKQVRNMQTGIDLTNGAGGSAALPRADRRQSCGIGNVRKEFRIADDVLRLIDAIELGRIQ